MNTLQKKAKLIFWSLNFLVPTLGLGYGTATIEMAKEYGIALTAGSNFVCSLDESHNVNCWGKNDYGQLNLPPLSRPTQISTGYEHVCALDETGVKCWGRKDDGQLIVPRLSQPKYIAAGARHSCAIDGLKVKCWGYDSYGEIASPKLDKPIQISAGRYFSCATIESGVKCWGQNSQGESRVPVLTHVTKISAGREHSCAIDSNEVKCWGSNRYGARQVPKLINPTQISNGEYHTCAIDSMGVSCWGEGNGNVSRVPKLEDPVTVASGRNFSCALDFTGIHCWGDLPPDVPNEFQSATLSVAPGLFNARQLGASLTRLSQYVYPEKAKFLQEVAKLAWALAYTSEIDPNYLAAMYLTHSLNPFFEELNAERISRYKDSYKTEIASLVKRGFASLKDYEQTRAVIKTSLSLTQAALLRLKPYATQDQQFQLAQLMIDIQMALSADKPRNEISKLVSDFQKAEPILRPLAELNKTRSFAHVLYGQIGFLTE